MDDSLTEFPQTIPQAARCFSLFASLLRYFPERSKAEFYETALISTIRLVDETAETTIGEDRRDSIVSSNSDKAAIEEDRHESIVSSNSDGNRLRPIATILDPIAFAHYRQGIR